MRYHLQSILMIIGGLALVYCIIGYGFHLVTLLSPFELHTQVKNLTIEPFNDERDKPNEISFFRINDDKPAEGNDVKENSTESLKIRHDGDDEMNRRPINNSLDDKSNKSIKIVFEGFNNETGVDKFIVPNIVHFIRFKKANFSFVDAVTVLAAFKNQRPDKIMFHTDDVNFVGHYWEKIKNTPGLVYEIVETTIPDTIFGQKFNQGWHLWHAGDVVRIKVLIKYGGIFLDNDSYIVRSLDKFRKFEMALGWYDDQCLGSQVLVANKDARFLRLWLESYRIYHADKWYYNAGCKPTEEILSKKPELVHRVKLLFGVHMLIHNLYKTYWEDWRKQYSIHLLMNHRSYLDKEHYDKYPIFTEDNIKTYNFTFGTMAREAYGISQ